MSMTVTRAQVEEALWRIAGRASWNEIEKVMRVIDAYAVTMARKIDNKAYVGMLADEGKPKRRAGNYLCKGCGRRMELSFFPEPKRHNPSLSYNCLSCQGLT